MRNEYIYRVIMATDSVQTKKRINIELPKVIIEKLDMLTSKANSSRSKFIRRFISEKLAEREKEEFEREMKEGYLANYDFIKESSREWDSTLGDGL